MIVLDASAAVDLLLNLSPRAAVVREQVSRAAPDVYAPHLLDAEVAQVLRRYVLRGEIGIRDAKAAIDALFALPIQRILEVRKFVDFSSIIEEPSRYSQWFNHAVEERFRGGEQKKQGALSCALARQRVS